MTLYLSEHDVVDVGIRLDAVSIAIVDEGRAIIGHGIDVLMAA